MDPWKAVAIIIKVLSLKNTIKTILHHHNTIIRIPKYYLIPSLYLDWLICPQNKTHIWAQRTTTKTKVQDKETALQQSVVDMINICAVIVKEGMVNFIWGSLGDKKYLILLSGWLLRTT